MSTRQLSGTLYARFLHWSLPVGFAQPSDSNGGKKTFAGAPPMPNTMTTLCMEALRPDATKTVDLGRNTLILSNISQRITKHSNPAKSLIIRALTIRNQQVAGSIPAGGSSNLFNFNYCSFAVGRLSSARPDTSRSTSLSLITASPFGLARGMLKSPARSARSQSIRWSPQCFQRFVRPSPNDRRRGTRTIPVSRICERSEHS